MLKLAAPVLSAVFANACVNYPGPQDLATEAPPAIADVKAQIDKDFCRYSTDQVSYGLPRETENRPAPLSGCSAYFPKHFLNTTIQASCASMFDIDDVGHVINLETRCNIASPRAAVPEGWARVAEQGFIYSIEKQLASWRYPGRGATTPEKRRHSIFVANDFGLGGQRSATKDEPPFQRPAPAPPLPSDLLEKIANMAADS